MSAFTFDPTKYEDPGFDLLPPGEYTAEVVEAEIKTPRTGDGHMLVLAWRICEGQFENRQVWQTICYDHSSEQTQDIARRMLKSMCVATGINEQITNPDVFKFKPCRVRVAIKQDKTGNYDDSNEIKRVKPLATNGEGPPPMPSTTPTKPSGPVGGPAGQAAPWNRKGG